MFYCKVHKQNKTHSSDSCKVLLNKKKKKESNSDSNSDVKEETNSNEQNTNKNSDNSDTSSKSSNESKINHNRNDRQRNKIKQARNKKPKNTTNFKPSFAPPDLRMKFYNPTSVGPVLKDELTVHDVCYVPSLFCEEIDTSVYDNILKEVTAASTIGDELFVEWHGDSHVIANDKVGGNWKQKCPTLLSVLEKMESFFDFETNATRVNWYRPDSEDWKPYHHDRAAFTAGEPQNFTIAASFGRAREVGFEHAKKGTKLFFSVANGSAYTFCRDVNIEWKHGVIPTKEQSDIGRISIIAWGLRKQSAEQSRVTKNDVPSASDLGLKE